MSKEREALKLARDVLLPYKSTGLRWYTDVDEALDAIEEVLAQPEHSCVACEGNPKGNNNPCSVCGTTQPEPPPECQTEVEKKAFAFGWFKAMESQRLAQPAQQQEPVGVVALDTSRPFVGGSYNGQAMPWSQAPTVKTVVMFKDLPLNTPLFIAPPQRPWVGLDFETIEECFPEGPSVFEDAYGDNHTSPRWLHAFAQAIEAKLKEKNA